MGEKLDYYNYVLGLYGYLLDNKYVTYNCENLNWLFTLNDKKVDSYEFVLKISYVKDLGYDKKVSVVVVQENDSNRWSVVESKPVTTEKK